MADKKISELTDGGAAITGDDYLVLVDAPSGVAATKRSSVTDFLAAATFDTALTDRGAVLAGRTSASGLGWVDTDTTLGADSATKVPSQHAVKTYVDAHAGASGDVHTTDTDASSWSWVLNETSLTSDSATKLPTQHSVKAYVDALPSLVSSDTTKIAITTAGGVTTLDVTALLSTGTSAFSDAAFTLQDNADATKQALFQCSSITTGTTATFTLPSATDTLAGLTSTQTFTNKTYTNPTIQSILASSAGITFKGSANTAVNDGSRTNMIEIFGSPSTAGRIAFIHQGTSDAAPSQTTSGNVMGTLAARGYTGAAYATANAATITFVADESQTTTARGSHVSMSVCPITTTTVTEGFRVTSDATPGGVVRGVLAVGAGSGMASATSGYGVEVKSGAIGYGTGTGGTVTQASSRTTGVTLNTQCGAITLVSAAGSTTEATFTVTNSVVAATDTILLSQKSGTDKYILTPSAVAAGSFNITFRTFSGTTTEQPVFNFVVFKAVTS